MARWLERADQVAHRAEVRLVGGARVLFDGLEAERRGVLEERGDVLVRVLAQRQAGLLRLDDGAVVDVREVHHVDDVVAHPVLERAPQHVDGDERPEVADVAARVDRQPAGVHPHLLAVERREGLFLAGEGVEEAHGNRWAHGCVPAAWPGTRRRPTRGPAG